MVLGRNYGIKVPKREFGDKRNSLFLNWGILGGNYRRGRVKYKEDFSREIWRQSKKASKTMLYKGGRGGKADYFRPFHRDWECFFPKREYPSGRGKKAFWGENPYLKKVSLSGERLV